MHAENRASTDDGWDYLFLSDVHLGSDLVPHLRPWARDSWLSAEAEIDRQLITFLSHYQQHPRRLCLIAAGDLLDLVGVSLTAEGTTLRTRPTREEQRHGLGSAADHVVRKIEAIAARHPRVFRALAEFLSAGHRLVVVRGNHDVELHWRAAQKALARAIAQHAERPQHGAEIEQRVEVCPWFFQVPGLLYVEHGHEFDAMCSYGDPLLPTCPADTRRIRASPFSVLLREVARPTRGLSTSHYENVALAEYMRLLVRLGISGTLRIALRFARAVKRLLHESVRAARGEAPLRKLHKLARERRFARTTRTDEQQLSALKRLYVRPAVYSMRLVLQSLYLDRVLAALLSVLCIVLGASLARYAQLMIGVIAFLPALPLAAYGLLGPTRDLSPRTRMRSAAAQIAATFGVRYVVMGHTHQAEDEPLPNEARYLNLGHWGSDDVPEEVHAGEPHLMRTFALISYSASGYRHQLMRWDAVLGARPHLLPDQPAQPEQPIQGKWLAP